jgi:2-oxo-4-hydroxy-4-carboxy-5-ureidoimidazoline decarboxylase
MAESAVCGSGAAVTIEAHLTLNALPLDAARAALGRCCGARRWVEAMLARRPFASQDALLSAADEESRALAPADVLEAFSHHPEIGSNLDELRRKFRTTAALSQSEQARVAGADEATLVALRAGNQAYRERFGYLFIVCATGKSAAEMLALLQARLHNDPDNEIRVAAAEQAKIARLRLSNLSP